MTQQSFHFLSDTKIEAYVESTGKLELWLQVTIPTGKNRYTSRRLQSFEFEVKQGETEAEFKFELEQREIEQLREWEESAINEEKSRR